MVLLLGQLKLHTYELLFDLRLKDPFYSILFVFAHGWRATRWAATGGEMGEEGS